MSQLLDSEACDAAVWNCQTSHAHAPFVLVVQWMCTGSALEEPVISQVVFQVNGEFGAVCGKILGIVIVGALLACD